MTPVLSLLIPIVVAAVFVFIASSIIHMATPFHKNDLKKFPNEDAVRNALKPLNLPPGDYEAEITRPPSAPRRISIRVRRGETTREALEL